MMTQTNTELMPSFIVMGLGATGLACLRFLTAKGYSVSAMDSRKEPPYLNVVKSEMPDVAVQTGNLHICDIEPQTIVVLSPGIDPRMPAIRAIEEQGIEIIGDIELFCRYANAKVVAITGSNGKSTVTTLLAEMIRQDDKKVAVGGNLGQAALSLLQSPAPDFYVLELSSFQLETVTSLDAYVSVVLNISPDHLDRYDSERQYQEAKARIYCGTGTMIINRDDPVVANWAIKGRRQIGFTSRNPKTGDFGIMVEGDEPILSYGDKKLLPASMLKLTGSHNVSNALAALALGKALGLSMTSMLAALEQYRGLAHRCQSVRKINQVRWFNDSKATNVGATVAAINGLTTTRNIILIAGGVAKDQDFSPLTSTLEKYVKAVILFGQDGDKIQSVVAEGIFQKPVLDMAEAVETAYQIAEANDIVLLSPACASFDLYSDYQERGNDFIRKVEGLCDG